MDARSRKALFAVLEGTMLKGFSTEKWGDFINYTPEGRATGCRVLRVVGKGRHLVLFSNQCDPFNRYWGSPRSKLLYLNVHGELVEFDSELVLRIHNEVGSGPNVGWERAVGEWLEDNSAMSFAGKDWAEACARRVRNLITRWVRHYSGIPKSNPEQAAVDIELLRSWGASVLKSEASADPKDLAEVLALRVRLGKVSRDSNPSLVLSLLALDRELEPYGATLLYLPKDEATAALEGTTPLEWWGVHHWALTTEALDWWAEQLNTDPTVDLSGVHPAEVLRAFLMYRESRGREQVNTYFTDERHQWRKTLDQNELVELAEQVRKNQDG
jgi:hypothetical protein